MAVKNLKTITTKTGVVVSESWCRKCANLRPASEFYEASDNGLVDTNGLFSVCKDCVQKIYNDIFEKEQSMEKTVHRMCIALNLRYSNEAVEATRTHIQTLLEGGKQVNAIFSIYKQKLMSVKKSMDKSIPNYDGYEDIGTIYTSKEANVKELAIPKEVVEFWGNDISKESIRFLENKYTSFKQTHKADSYAEITLLQQVCYTLLDIKNLRANGDDTDKAVKQLQSLMNNLTFSPSTSSSMNVNGKGMDAFGLWIKDIEESEPAQWLKTDPRGDLYRDVGDIELYFQRYIVRPLKNFITGSKDFNVEEDSTTIEDYNYEEGENEKAN